VEVKPVSDAKEQARREKEDRKAAEMEQTEAEHAERVWTALTDATTADCAKAHDLRRAFGTRWSKRVMPAVLQRLMRHADIQTTMSYYVDLTAADLSAELWAGFASREGKIPAAGNKTGNNGRFGAGVESRNSLPEKTLRTGTGGAVARFGID
jgi:hypothetical protein